MEQNQNLLENHQTLADNVVSFHALYQKIAESLVGHVLANRKGFPIVKNLEKTIEANQDELKSLDLGLLKGIAAVKLGEKIIPEIYERLKSGEFRPRWIEDYESLSNLLESLGLERNSGINADIYGLATKNISTSLRNGIKILPAQELAKDAYLNFFQDMEGLILEYCEKGGFKKELIEKGLKNFKTERNKKIVSVWPKIKEIKEKLYQNAEKIARIEPYVVEQNSHKKTSKSKFERAFSTYRAFVNTYSRILPIAKKTLEQDYRTLKEKLLDNFAEGVYWAVNCTINSEGDQEVYAYLSYKPKEIYGNNRTTMLQEMLS